MSSLLSKIVSKILIDGLGKLSSAVINFFSRKYREYSRKKKAKKFEETGDPKDLLDLERDLNDQ
jgi:hypothetical protein